MDTLNSIDYSELINWIAYNKYGVQLNKTQMQKLLFMCYGFYLAKAGKPLFSDDSPKAWPFGPVFPRVNKKFIPGVKPSEISTEKQKNFSANPKALDIVAKVVEKFYKVSAHDLSEWSHKEGGPWSKTIYGEDGNNKNIVWNKKIEDDIICDYFKGLEL